MLSFRPAPEPTVTSFGRSVAVSLMRIGGPVIFGIMHGRELAEGAYRSIWLDQPWQLAEFLGERCMGYGKVVGGAFVAIAALCLPALVMGLLTRIASGLLLTFAVIGALMTLGTPACEVPLLYAMVFLAVVLAGPGGFSLDALLTRRR